MDEYVVRLTIVFFFSKSLEARGFSNSRVEGQLEVTEKSGNRTLGLVPQGLVSSDLVRTDLILISMPRRSS